MPTFLNITWVHLFISIFSGEKESSLRKTVTDFPFSMHLLEILLIRLNLKAAKIRIIAKKGKRRSFGMVYFAEEDGVGLKDGVGLEVVARTTFRKFQTLVFRS